MQSAGSGTQTVILFDRASLPLPSTRTAPEDSKPPATDLLKWLLWSSRWEKHRPGEVVIALPKEAKEWVDRKKVGPTPVIWYGRNGDCPLPFDHHEQDLLLVNGPKTFSIPWSVGTPPPQCEGCDVLVIREEHAAEVGRYSEFVQVDSDGLVQRFVRRYSDSRGPLVEPSATIFHLLCGREHADVVVRHLLIHGWGLDSIGALTSRLRVQWWKPEITTRRRDSGATGRRVASNEPNPDDREWDGVPSIAVESKGDLGYRIIKRSTDVVLSAVTLLLLSPVLLILVLIVKFTSRGPVFYADRRQGLHGKEFNCLKFRTMVTDAAEMQARLREKNQVDGPQFKMENDPRLTPVGDWLRKFSFDELPQFFNVLRGDMSLVGPRPSPDRENQFCPGWRRARLSVRPGITGLWQVLRRRGDGVSDFQQWIYYDLEYVRHRGLWLDWQLLWHTPIAMLASSRLGKFAHRLKVRGICIQSNRIREMDSSYSFVEVPLGPGAAIAAPLAIPSEPGTRSHSHRVDRP